MSVSRDNPLALARGLWQGMGWFFGQHPLVNRDGIDAMHRAFSQQAMVLRHLGNPYLADVLDHMADDFYASALDALAKRGP